MNVRSIIIAAALAASATAAQAQDAATHVLIVSGLGGEPPFSQSFAEWGAAVAGAATRKYGVPAANVVWLAEEKGVHALVRDRATKANVESALRAIATRAGAQDRVLILLIGHGTSQNGENRINLPGPDITGRELAALLQPLSTQQVAVVNTASASGGFIGDLAAPNRIVITATKSGFEQNEAVFGRHFTAALAGDAADTDKDGRVSLLEAFDFARLEVEREYRQANKLQTEHAQLDGLGDGKGVAAVDAQSLHGRAPRNFYLGGITVAGGAAASAELRTLQAEKTRIEDALAALRARRDSMNAAEYEAELEKLLLGLARNGQAIRRLTGGS